MPSVNLIVNSTVGAAYFNTAGNPITAQPDTDSGAIAGTRTSELDDTKWVGKTPGDPIRQASSVITSVSGDDVYVTTVNAGTLAYIEEGFYVINGYSTSLAGLGNNTLRSPGADHADRVAIHRLENIRTTRTGRAIRDGYWNEVSGTWNTDPTEARDTFGEDNTTRLTPSIPGRLTYSFGDTDAPATGTYEARQLW